MIIDEKDETMYKNMSYVTPHVYRHDTSYKRIPKTLREKTAKCIVHLLALFFNIVFKFRYGHRAIVLETIAAVPGMVGALFQHLKSLRRIQKDHGRIRALLDEAENERVHLLVYNQIAKPTTFERLLIIGAQMFFFIFYFCLYAVSSKTAHCVVGYLEEEAIHSYTRYHELVVMGMHKNVPATELAKMYWNLPDDARLTDIIDATIKDETLHRDVNHKFADVL